MNLDRLEELTRAAKQLSWWDEHVLRYHLRVADGTCPETDPPFIAACDPATILKLVAVVRAADSFLRHTKTLAGPTMESLEGAALRAALEELKP